MNIMRPKLIKIGDMCFRRFDVPNDGIINDYTEQVFGPQKPIVKDVDELWDESPQKVVPKLKPISALEDDSQKCEDIKDISEGKGNLFRAEVEVAKYFHKFIIGFRGNQKQDIEYESKCRLIVPNQTDLTCKAIVITGNTIPDVKYAIQRIKTLVKRARNTSDFTHFVSIPFNDKSICDRFLIFKTKIMKDNEINGMTESLFQNINQLHLTVVPLLLVDQKEKDIASQILDDCLQTYIKPLLSDSVLRVKLEGIDYMNDDPTKVNVIYAKVNDMSDNQCLQSIVDHIFSRLEESGLAVRSHEMDRMNAGSKVKLHVTLMNTKFRDNKINEYKRGGRPDPKRGNPKTKSHFDGSVILNKFKDYYFGEINVETIEISIRHSNHGKNGYYSHSSRIDL